MRTLLKRDYLHPFYLRSLSTGLIGFFISKSLSLFVVLKLHQSNVQISSSELWQTMANEVWPFGNSLTVEKTDQVSHWLVGLLVICSVESVANLVLMIASRRKSFFLLAIFVGYRILCLLVVSIAILAQSMETSTANLDFLLILILVFGTFMVSAQRGERSARLRFGELFILRKSSAGIRKKEEGNRFQSEHCYSLSSEWLPSKQDT